MMNTQASLFGLRALPCHCLSGCDALTGTLQAGMRSGFLFVRSDAVRRFRLFRCDALTGTLQTGMRRRYYPAPNQAESDCIGNDECGNDG